MFFYELFDQSVFLSCLFVFVYSSFFFTFIFVISLAFFFFFFFLFVVVWIDFEENKGLTTKHPCGRWYIFQGPYRTLLKLTYALMVAIDCSCTIPWTGSIFSSYFI